MNQNGPPPVLLLLDDCSLAVNAPGDRATAIVAGECSPDRLVPRALSVHLNATRGSLWIRVVQLSVHRRAVRNITVCVYDWGHSDECHSQQKRNEEATQNTPHLSSSVLTLRARSFTEIPCRIAGSGNSITHNNI
jgi:hypothetical protein